MFRELFRAKCAGKDYKSVTRCYNIIVRRESQMTITGQAEKGEEI